MNKYSRNGKHGSEPPKYLGKHAEEVAPRPSDSIGREAMDKINTKAPTEPKQNAHPTSPHQEAWERGAERSYAPSGSSVTRWPYNDEDPHQGGYASHGNSHVTGGKNWGAFEGYKSCTHKPKAVRIGDTRIYAAKESDLSAEALAHFDIVSPLLESAHPMYQKYTGLLLWFPIRDFSAPDPQRLRVHCERLLLLARQGAKILTFCMGSHGRTGTVLAACIALAEPEEDPIDTVRERHCSKAVETSTQIAAVFEVAGKPIPQQWRNKAQRHDHTAIYTKQPLSPIVARGLGEILTPETIGKGHYGVNLNTQPAEGRSLVVTDSGVALPPIPVVSVRASAPTEAEKLEDAALVDFEGNEVLTPSQLARLAAETVEVDMEQPLSSTVLAQLLAQAEARGDTEQVGYLDDELSLALAEEDEVRAQARLQRPTTADAGPHPSTEGGVAAASRPFPESWSKRTRQKLHGAVNTRTSEGYLICPLCGETIAFEENAQLVKSRVGFQRVGSIIRRPRIRWVKHKSCNGQPKPESLGCYATESECI